MVASLDSIIAPMTLCLFSSVIVVLARFKIADWIPGPDPGRPGNF
jgi:hypothetical protein